MCFQENEHGPTETYDSFKIYYTTFVQKNTCMYGFFWSKCHDWYQYLRKLMM